MEVIPSGAGRPHDQNTFLQEHSAQPVSMSMARVPSTYQTCDNECESTWRSVRCRSARPANGGFDGLLFVISLILASWVVRSVFIGAAGGAERRRQAEVERQRNEAQQHETQRKIERERQAERRREQAEHGQRQRQREQASKQAEEGNWWAVLEVSRDASRDEIRRAYRRKIWRCHPDRVTWLVPEFLELAERQSRTLNAAYAEANRASRGTDRSKNLR